MNQNIKPSWSRINLKDEFENLDAILIDLFICGIFHLIELSGAFENFSVPPTIETDIVVFSLLL